MQKIIQIHPCLLKLSRKQESVTDGRKFIGKTYLTLFNLEFNDFKIL